MQFSTGAERTCQRAMPEVEFYDVVAKLANVRWECEARVATKAATIAVRIAMWNNSLGFQANNLDGQLACARGYKVNKSVVALIPGTEPTCQRAEREVELCDAVAKLVDVRRKSKAIVASEAELANDALRFHANDCERQFSWR